MQHAGADNVPDVGVDAVQDAPVEAEYDASDDRGRVVGAATVAAAEDAAGEGGHALGFASAAADLAPSLEKVVGAELSRVHELVQHDGELQRQGLECAGQVRQPHRRRVGEDVARLEDDRLRRLVLGRHVRLRQALRVDPQLRRRPVVERRCERPDWRRRLVGEAQDQAPHVSSELGPQTDPNLGVLVEDAVVGRQELVVPDVPVRAQVRGSC